MVYRSKSKSFNHYSSIAINSRIILSKLAKEFKNRVKKGKCSLAEVYMSLKSARMKSTQWEVGDSHMFLQSIKIFKIRSTQSIFKSW